MVMLFQNIAVAYDGSNLSRKALERAVQIAQASNAKLSIVHVFQLPVYIVGEAALTLTKNQAGLYDDAQALLDEAKNLVPPELDLTLVMKMGNPAKEILDYADKAGLDLIVMGSRGLGPIREFILGSVSHNVVQHSKVPVLIVK